MPQFGSFRCRHGLIVVHRRCLFVCMAACAVAVAATMAARAMASKLLAAVCMNHLRFLRYVDEVARPGSIRQAAERLHVAPSAVNRRILDLEDELGTPIFERLPRGKIGRASCRERV